MSRNVNGWFTDVAGGINYADRTKDKFQPEGGLNTKDNATGNYWQLDPSNLLGPTNLSYAGAGTVLAWDVPGVLANCYKPIVYGSPTDAGFDYLIGKNWNVQEKVATAYVKAVLDHKINSDVTLKGNLGLQFVRTDQSSKAAILTHGIDAPGNTTSVVSPFTDGKKYTDVLPAINLVVLLPEKQAVRLGLARELARARMDQLKASSEQGISQFGVPGGSGGNPKLDPWRAHAFDVSYEKYFASRGYVSLAGFYKKLKSYIYNQTDANHDFSDFIATLPPGFLPPGVTPHSTGSFSGPVNGSGGKLEGLELAVSLPGDLVSDALRGFGAILSISQTQSNIEIKDPPGNNFITGNGLGTIPLPGLAKTVWNTTFYYEQSGFSARIATRSRSKYIGEVTNFANDRAFKYVKGDEITDLQLGYEFGSGRLKGLSVLFQANNLTNAPCIAYAVTETRQQDFQQYGRQFLVGLNYKIQ